MKNSTDLPDPETAKLVQQLQIHQLELELQIEELRIARALADAATQKYAELYDFAPSGYFTLNKEGEITELNLCGAQILRKDRNCLTNKQFPLFVSDDDRSLFRQFLERVFNRRTRQICEVALVFSKTSSVYVHITGIASSANEDRCLLTVIDITARRIAEDELKNSRFLMHSSLESQTGMLILSIDTNFRYLYFNSAHYRVMKSAYKADIEIGLNILELITADAERAVLGSYFDRALSGESFAVVRKFSNEPAIYYESFFNPLLNENHEIVGATTFARDITNQKLAEKLLSESKARLDKTQEIAHLGSWELDLQSGILTWSDEVYRIFGLLPQEFEATHAAFLESVYPEDREPLNLAYFSSVEKNEIGCEIEHRIIRRHTGEVRYAYEKCEHIRDASGQIVRSVGMVQDITEHKLSEYALVESESKFRKYMESAPDSIFIVNDHSQYVEVNEMVSTSLGYSRDEMLRFKLRDIIADEALQDGQAHYKKLKESGKAVSDLLLKHKNGSKIWMTINAVRLSPERFLCYGKDITEKKLIENELLESEEKFRSFIRYSSDLIFSFNRDETYRFVNDAFARLKGKDVQEIIGRTLHDIFAHDEAESRIPLLRKVLQTGKKGEHESTITDASGEVRTFLTTADPYKNEHGKVLYVNCVSKDITQVKKTEQALREKEEIFQSFMEYSPYYVFFKDENLRTLNLSRNYERMLGKPLSELLGKKLSEVLPSELAGKLEADDIKTMKSVEVITSEEELSGRFYSTIKFPVLVKGKPRYLAGYTIDITERKKTEEALKESQAQINALLEALPDMIFIQDFDGVYLEYHGQLSNELYSLPENFIGKNMDEVIPAELANKFKIAFEAARQSLQVQLVEYSLQLPDGLYYFEAKVVIFSDSKFLSLVRNVSVHKNAEKLIKQKNEDLLRINAEKDKFFSIIAHDLRGPFSGFLGLTENLAKRLPDMTLKQIQEITILMQKSAVHLFRLLGNLLEWSRMQRGLTVFVPESFLVGQKISDYLALANQLAGQKAIQISVRVPDNLVVFADENMFESILRNLLSNALKFTPKGGTILVSATKCSDNLVKISVTDSGIGMNQQLIGHLFRLDEKYTNRKGTEGEYSSGLGLIICKDFIEKHGGKLEIESEEGKGSTFSFFLPGNKSS